jgi:hypothetical protein
MQLDPKYRCTRKTDAQQLDSSVAHSNNSDLEERRRRREEKKKADACELQERDNKNKQTTTSLAFSLT